MKSWRIAWIGLAICASCAEPEPSAQGIQTRLAIDRGQALVGDPIGVTVEIETPPGYAIEIPAAPGGGDPFISDDLRRLDPLPLTQGVRHTLLWTLRPTRVGDHALPVLEIPLKDPEGRIQKLPVGGTPFRVRSVREEVPEQELFFDIRSAPEPTAGTPWLGIGSFLLVALSLAGFVFQRTLHLKQETAGPDGEFLRRQALEELEIAYRESDARLLAEQLATALRKFIALRWQIETFACTPKELGELDDRIAEPLIGILEDLERARFCRAPSRESVERAGREASAVLSNVVGD